MSDPLRTSVEPDQPAVNNPAGDWRRALRVLMRRHFSPYRVYVNRERRMVVVLNPKVGTQSFRYALNRALREFQGREDVSGGRYRWWKKAREFPVAPLRDYLHAFRCADDYAFFCFVRNPYSRMRSAWLNKFAFGHRDGYRPSAARKMVPPLRRFARQHGYPGGEDNAAIPFSTFVAFVESEQTGKRDHHWDEQYSVLMMDEIRYAQAYQLETQYHEGMTRIFSRLGIDPAVSDEFVATRRNASTRPSEPVFTEELAARARRIYARDFATFGYDEASWRGL